VIKEESAKDPIFKKVADHFLDFRKKYAIWGDAQVVKPTYHSQCDGAAPCCAGPLRFVLRAPTTIRRAHSVNCTMATGEVSAGRGDQAKREWEHSARAVLGGICPHGLRRRGRA
jgi:hypothetical protein